MSLSERDSKVNWHPFSALSEEQCNISIVKAEGAYLYDENGKKYLDAVSSWWVNLHGHAHPHIVNVLSEQAKQIDHIIYAGFTHPKAVELSERLLKFVPGNYTKVFYSDDGSTANEVAIKMALQYFVNKNEARKKIIAFENAYHGDTFGVMSVSGRSIFNEAFNDKLFVDVIHLPSPENGYSESQWREIENYFAEDVAAFIFEPLVLGAGGMLMYDANVLNRLLSLAKNKNIITITDEVFTGFGRTGKFFATEYLNVKADIICLSKGITAGILPLGVTMVNKKVEDNFSSKNTNNVFYHGHSYTANAIACAVACANLDLMTDELRSRINQISESHLNFIKKINHSNILQARSLGTILAINYKDSQNNYKSNLRDKIYNYFIKKGLLMRPLGNVCYIVPPYCITQEELNFIYDSMLELADELN